MALELWTGKEAKKRHHGLFKVRLQNWSGGISENHEVPQSWYTVPKRKSNMERPQYKLEVLSLRQNIRIDRYISIF